MQLPLMCPPGYRTQQQDRRHPASRKDGPLKVGIDARLVHGTAGGVESVIVGLAAGLSSLDGPEEFLFLTIRGEDEWIRRHLWGNARALRIPGRGRLARQLRSWTKRSVPGATGLHRRLRLRTARKEEGPPRSDGTIERAGAHVMHLVKQSGFLTDLPSIYHPHDLQHRHLPQLFERAEVDRRERWYAALCAEASMVAVASSWTRQDVIRELRIPPEKVRVVPWAPPIEAFSQPTEADIEKVKNTLQLPDRFVFYPAQTWPHKNHIALLQALEVVRRKYELVVPLVLSGRRTAEAADLDAIIGRLGLQHQVRWLGFVEPESLTAIYRLASAVVIPSKFEAVSAPLWEAFSMGVPAACSNVTSLPAQAGDAAIVFDPDAPDQIAESIVRLWTDAELCRVLVRKGRITVSGFTWEKTARLFRAHYRRLAGRPSTEEDRELMDAHPPL